MPWLKIDDGMVEHVKVASLSDGAFRAHIEALSYAARNLTDGFLPDAVARKQGWSRHAKALVKAGVWDVAEDGHMIHDYLEYNPSREQVEQERAAARDRMHRRRAPRSSRDVRANIDRTSPEVREKFNDPVPDPLERSDQRDLSEDLVDHRARVEKQSPPSPEAIRIDGMLVEYLGIQSPPLGWAQSWLDRGRTTEDVRQALNIAREKGGKSTRYVDAVLDDVQGLRRKRGKGEAPASTRPAHMPTPDPSAADAVDPSDLPAVSR